MLYQHEKNILSKLADYHENKAKRYQIKSTGSDMNKEIYLKQMETELKKAKTLRRAVNI